MFPSNPLISTQLQNPYIVQPLLLHDSLRSHSPRSSSWISWISGGGATKGDAFPRPREKVLLTPRRLMAKFRSLEGNLGVFFLMSVSSLTDSPSSQTIVPSTRGNRGNNDPSRQRNFSRLTSDSRGLGIAYRPRTDARLRAEIRGLLRSGEVGQRFRATLLNPNGERIKAKRRLAGSARQIELS